MIRVNPKKHTTIWKNGGQEVIVSQRECIHGLSTSSHPSQWVNIRRQGEGWFKPTALSMVTKQQLLIDILYVKAKVRDRTMHLYMYIGHLAFKYQVLYFSRCNELMMHSMLTVTYHGWIGFYAGRRQIRRSKKDHWVPMSVVAVPKISIFVTQSLIRLSAHYRVKSINFTP